MFISRKPNITTDEAFSLSKQMTTGQKMNLFILDLSFLGWYFLGFLCFGIGALFVKPYEICSCVYRGLFDSKRICKEG